MPLLLRLVVLLALWPTPLLASPADPTGLWWADRGAAQVEIVHCGDSLCGSVVWLRSPWDEDGCPLQDRENPDPALRGRNVIGIELLRDLRRSPEEPGAWEGGQIYDPGSGRTYRVVLRMDGPDRLRLRGYLGIQLLGRTTTWIRVGSEMQCRQDT